MSEVGTGIVRTISAQRAVEERPAAAVGAAMASAREFETMAINQMVQPLFDTVEIEQGPFDGGAAEKMFKPMLVEQIAKSIEKSGGIGLADSVCRQMLLAQEHAR